MAETLAAKGSYVLLLRLVEDTPLTIGRLGRFTFPAGYYLYMGSALGPGGLATRLTRHARKQKKRHWHIDYLLEKATLLETWEAETEDRRECHLARAALALDGRAVPAPGFGASDCRCRTHLVHLRERPDITVLVAHCPQIPLRSRPLAAPQGERTP